MKKNTYGIALVMCISIAATLIHQYLLGFLETMTIGILLGMLSANTLGNPKKCDSGISYSLKHILKWGIVLMGVKLNFALIMELGPKILLLIVSLIAMALVLANAIGKSFKLNAKLSTLLGVGSSICGASAIIAMGPVIEAEDEDIAISVTVISLLGAIGVLAYSFISTKLPLTDLQYGIWSGSSLQGVAHALAAAGARSGTGVSIEVGTLVKMARVALLGPVALVLGSLFSGGKSSSRLKFPRYVLYFILVGAVFTLNNSYQLVPTAFSLFDMQIDVVAALKALSNFFILMAMVSMGLKVNLRSFENKAKTALAACSILFLIISLASISYIVGVI